jgi:hypothetical protein
MFFFGSSLLGATGRKKKEEVFARIEPLLQLSQLCCLDLLRENLGALREGKQKLQGDQKVTRLQDGRHRHSRALK